MCLDVWMCVAVFLVFLCFFFFQAEDGIRDAQESRGLGDVYKRQITTTPPISITTLSMLTMSRRKPTDMDSDTERAINCLLYTSDAADDLLCVDLGGRRIIKKKKRR